LPVDDAPLDSSTSGAALTSAAGWRADRPAAAPGGRAGRLRHHARLQCPDESGVAAGGLPGPTAARSRRVSWAICGSRSSSSATSSTPLRDSRNTQSKRTSTWSSRARCWTGLRSRRGSRPRGAEISRSGARMPSSPPTASVPRLRPARPSPDEQDAASSSSGARRQTRAASLSRGTV
jgi:hypothetical protein